MIGAHFGLDTAPFSRDRISLMPAQQDIFDTLRVHCQQGGLCVVVGEPGCGKSVLKDALCGFDKKRMITPVVNRTLHTYHNTLRILCEAFEIGSEGRSFACERRLIEEAHTINQRSKMLAMIVDDAHLLDIEALRRLRLLLEDFPKNHNLILLAQPPLLSKLSLSVNEDIKSRVTYSVKLLRLRPDEVVKFVEAELDKVALPHTTFTEEAMALIARSSEGALRAVRNLCLGSMLEAVRDRTRVVDLPQVNRVLLQPHWRKREEILG